MDKYENYKKVFDKYNGVITTAEFREAGYHHKYLKELMDKGIIRKIKEDIMSGNMTNLSQIQLL